MSNKKKSNKRGSAWKKIAKALSKDVSGLTIREIMEVTGLSRSTVADNLNAQFGVASQCGSDGRLWYLEETPDNKKVEKAAVKSKKKPRVRGEAWEKICGVLMDVTSLVTFEGLLDLTGLPRSTLADNLVEGRISVEGGFRLNKVVSAIGVTSWYLSKPFETECAEAFAAEDIASMHETYGVLIRQVDKFAANSVEHAKATKELAQGMVLVREEVAELRRELRLVDKMERLLDKVGRLIQLGEK